MKTIKMNLKPPALGLIFALAFSLSACDRVPSTFSAKDVDSAPAASAPGRGFSERLDLTRLNQIEEQIDASLARLDAAFDPNAPEANLDKLVVGTEIDTALATSPFLTRDQIIDKKFDDKNKALINDDLSGNLDNVEDTASIDPNNFSQINLQRAARIQQQLDQKAIDAVKSKSTDTKTDKTDGSSTSDTSLTEKKDTQDSSPPADAQEGTRESL
jgi:hypothetical protein